MHSAWTPMESTVPRDILHGRADGGTVAFVAALAPWFRSLANMPSHDVAQVDAHSHWRRYTWRGGCDDGMRREVGVEA
ncbi:uncharacterized protein N7459_000881 [Penicillium hispanicum]|uniref:uncharacterized protein n=1 Tax=Penicillium hispanicum TaxID=1080232 RepID=UPI0025415449|nr:uncharacterized protein N7459_000881 [Penicillium hispanicum]KAJ5594673.1 hypothetical protein N7459_000881 [Penicillium hispanicum]